MELCIHEMPVDWCAICSGADADYGHDNDYDDSHLTFEGLLNGSRESGN